MSRRAKVKIAANLTARRSESKSKVEISTAKNVFAQCDEILSIKVEKGDNQKQNNTVTAVQEDVTEDVTTTIDEKSINGADVKPSESSSKKKIENVNEKVSEDEPASKKIKSDTVSITPPIVSSLPDDENTFKTPSNVTRVDENATQSLSISGNTSLLQQQQQQKSNKFRRQKIIPRLAATRTPKVEEIEVSQKSPTEDISDVFDEQVVTKQQPETNVFEDWPIPPLSPSKQRFETIKEYHDPLSSPIIINNNLQPPPVPTSPFPHHPQHSRVRTESLCSMKSTMSAYNKDISGVVRKNFRTEENNRIIDTKRESKERLNNKNLEKNQLRMFDMIYYNPTSNPMKTKANPAKEKEQKKPIKLDVKIESPVVKVKEPDTLANFLVPQLKLGPNGEMILDETSLVVENEQQKQNRILLANANVVYDDELSGTYGYYTRQKRTREWPADETVKFYRCLHTIGTDFSLMLNLFPNRTRRDLKLKFKKEEKSNGALINKALLHPNMFDIDELQRELDNDEKIKKKALETKSKAESNELIKKGIMKKHQAAKDKLKKKTKVERILSDGDLVLNLANDNLQQEAVKENLLVPMPEKKPRKSRKKPEIKVPEMSIVQEIIVDNPPMAKIEERFAELMPDKMNYSISAKEDSYQNSDESLVTNESNQLNYTNNNTYFYDEMGNRIECELMNEEDLVVIDLPEDMPSSIPNEATFNAIESATEMDQNYNCDASDDGSVRSFQTVFYNENGVNHDPEPMDIEMNEQDEVINERTEEPQEILTQQIEEPQEILTQEIEEPQEILTQQIEEPQEILTQPIEEPQEIVNTPEVEQQEVVKEQKYGHRRILIEEEDEEVVDELNNDQETEEDQEMLKELPEEENVAINENIDLNKKCKVETAEILNTEDSIGVKEEQMTQPITNIVEAEVFAKEEQLTQPEIVEAQVVTEDYEEVAEDIVVKKETLQNTTPEIPAQEISHDESWNAEENYQTTNDPELQEELNAVDDEQQTQSDEIITPLELSSHDTSFNTIWGTGEYYLSTNDPDVQEKMNVVDVFHQQPTTSTVIAPPELSTQTPITWNPDEYYQSTNDPDVQEKMNVVDIPCTSNTPAPDEYEDLMKSIDFNSLVLAESQVDGKTVNEIYTMDSITEELSEKPLNLPQHVVDKIVSILNSADSDEEDA